MDYICYIQIFVGKITICTLDEGKNGYVARDQLENKYIYIGRASQTSDASALATKSWKIERWGN